MKKLFVTFVFVAGSVAHAGPGNVGSVGDADSIPTHDLALVQQHISWDLEGKASCFNQAVHNQKEAMIENYGGRFSVLDLPDVEMLLTEESQDRNIDKYCTYKDANGRSVDYEEAVSKDCHTSATRTYVVAAKFQATTSGTIETEALVAMVSIERKSRFSMDADKDYVSEDPGKIRNEKKEVKIVCKKIDDL